MVLDEEITHLRLRKEYDEWALDGADDEGNYSGSCWTYETFEEAVADLDDFAWTFPNLRGKRP